MADPKKPKVDQSKETRVYTADMGQPPMDPEVAPPTPKASAPKPAKKYAKGGAIDGIAQRGKTRGKIC
jgi:hypothetical protein